MTDSIDAIAAKIVDAAYEISGRPPEKWGVHIAEIIRKQDVPAYFWKKAAVAREPRSRELWERLRNIAADDDGGAEFVIDLGLRSLAHGATLPPDQRRMIDEFQKFKEWQEKVHTEVDNENKQTPDWIAHGSGTDPVDAIAEKLIEAAYEHFGRPPEAGGEYIHTVIRETDVPGYFRKTLQCARGPRSRALWQYFKEIRNHDAEMVMDAGLKYLSQHATLPADERRLIEEIKNFQEWRLAIQHEITDEWNDFAEWEAGLSD